MNKRNSEDFNEIKLLILELSQQFNRKFEDQTRVIRQQRDRLESQQEQLHSQRAIIEELAWQIRDLRDSVRKFSEKISSVQSKYRANSPESHLKLNIPDVNSTRQSNHRAGRQRYNKMSFPHSTPSFHLSLFLCSLIFSLSVYQSSLHHIHIAFGFCSFPFVARTTTKM